MSEYLAKYAINNCELALNERVKRLLGDLSEEIEGIYLIAKMPGLSLDTFELLYGSEPLDDKPTIKAILSDSIINNSGDIKSFIKGESVKNRISCFVIQTTSELTANGIYKGVELKFNHLNQYLNDVRIKEKVISDYKRFSKES